MASINGTQGHGEMTMAWKRAQADYVRNLRLDAGLTQAEVAEALGLRDKQMISAIETGRNNVPPARIVKMADILGVDQQEFAKVLLRYQHPWIYAILFGADTRLKAEIKAAGVSDREARSR